MIGGLQGEEWKFIQNIQKKRSRVESTEIGENSHHARGCAKWCANGVRVSHTSGAVVLRTPYLPRFSSKSYTV